MISTPIDLESTQQKPRHTLKVIDKHLLNRDWLETNHSTIADVACYPYIELASDAQIALEAYPQVSAWVTRIKQLPLYVTMPGF
ncbi:glutathione binding-like protein [uncultured Nostoc sp.]|uniref:glutathione binding-like protein n=1 Tax=uncultured Nostoc sp. TaxID=340711 RepID=UPI0035CBA69F